MIVLDRVTSTTTLSNTASETTMYTYSVPANMGAKSGEVLSLNLTLSLLNDSGADRTYTLRVKFGGTTYITKALIAVPTSIFPRSMLLSVVIQNSGTTSTQSILSSASISDVSSNAAIYGNVGAAPLLPPVNQHVSGTVDQTAAQTLAVTLQSDAATSTQTIVTRAGLLTLA